MFIDMILELLSESNKSLSLEEISKATGYSPKETDRTIRLLASIGFIEYDEAKACADIDPELREAMTSE